MGRLARNARVDRIVDGFRKKPWKAEDFEGLNSLADEEPTLLPELAQAVIEDLPSGGAFFDALLSWLPRPDLEFLADEAVSAYSSSKANDAAESVIDYVSLQHPAALTPHLPLLWMLVADRRSYTRDWPWRGADDRELERLGTVLTDGRRSEDSERAWRCLLEARSESAWQAAWSHRDRVARKGAKWAEACWALVGIEAVGGRFRRLCPINGMHFVVPESALIARGQPWLERRHPTWGPAERDFPEQIFGGMSDARCAYCSDSLRRIILLDPIPEGLGVTSRHRLDVAYCYRCVGAAPSQHRHDKQGRPQAVTEPDHHPIPFELEEPRSGVRVGLRRAGDRWRFQDWALSNGRENLNRLGGEFTWIQNPEFLRCVSCGKAMTALLQVDWYHLIAGEGITYVLWCDDCAASGLTFQQT